jgi:hypothetical protein
MPFNFEENSVVFLTIDQISQLYDSYNQKTKIVKHIVFYSLQTEFFEKIELYFKSNY